MYKRQVLRHQLGAGGQLDVLALLHMVGLHAALELAGADAHKGLSLIHIFLLRSGQLRSYLLSEDGRDVTLYRLFGGEVCLSLIHI